MKYITARKPYSGRGYGPDSAWGAYSAPQTLADGKGALCISPKNPTPALSLSGLELWPPLCRPWIRHCTVYSEEASSGT